MSTDEEKWAEMALLSGEIAELNNQLSQRFVRLGELSRDLGCPREALFCDQVAVEHRKKAVGALDALSVARNVSNQTPEAGNTSAMAVAP